MIIEKEIEKKKKIGILKAARRENRRAYKASLRCVNHPRNTKKGEKNETNKARSIRPVTTYDSLMSVQQTLKDV